MESAGKKLPEKFVQRMQGMLVDEYEDFAMIQDKLEKISLTADALQLWVQDKIARGGIDQKKLERWIILLKKSLIRKSFKQGMSMPEKIRMMFRYLPFPAAVKMLAGTIIKRGR